MIPWNKISDDEKKFVYFWGGLFVIGVLVVTAGVHYAWQLIIT